MKGRKTGSKLISLILSLVMIVTLLPATVMAAPGDSGTADDAQTLDWKDIPGGTYYERTQSMTTDGEYVILYQGDRSNMALHYYSWYGTVGVNGQSVGVSSQNGQYTITDIDETATWHINNDGKIYCTVNGQNYYLVRSNSNASVTTKSDSALVWQISARSSGAVRFNTSGERSLRWNDRTFQIRDDKGTRDLYLYEKRSSLGGQAALTGTLSYTVKTGSSLTEDQIKEAASVLYRTDAGSEETTLDWNEVTVSWDNSLNTNTVGTYTMTVSYQDTVLGTITVDVQETVLDKTQPNWGLNPAQEPYPEYPADGAVRMNKTATEQSLNDTGLAKVELDVAGVSVKTGVDVVLVVDVSNSMAWSVENSGGGNDAEKLPDPGQSTKLEDAMEAATQFADILLADNEPGNKTNNTISMVTFAGYDADNYGGSSTNIDSVRTYFTQEEDFTAAENYFNSVYFESEPVAGSSSGSVTYTLHIGADEGVNRGNTNYDYAFWEASRAVSNIQNSYDGDYKTDRETVVVFMTDGAPSHYDNERAQGDEDVLDRLPGTGTQYPNPANNITEASWLGTITSPNQYATDLYNQVDGFYAVGFDLAHGGFSKFSWTEEELTPVLAGMADGHTIPVTAATDRDALEAFYRSLATQIRYAGTEAEVTDTLMSDVTLQMSNTITTSTGNVNLAEKGITPAIEVTLYDLYAPGTILGEGDNAVDVSGRRTGDYTVEETVTFNETGTAAYSNLIDNGERNILSTEDGVTTISAMNFTYTKDASGKESFMWNIGNITNQEIALSYYVYLKGSMTGQTDPGIYDTNEEAVLKYVDVNGKYAERKFPRPKIGWGGASTTYEFYLVDYAGYPVNHNGDRISFENRILIGEPETEMLNQNAGEEVSARIAALDKLPPGYFLYDNNAYYEVQTSSGESVQGSLTVSLPSDDAKKVTVVDGIQITQTGAQTTKEVSWTPVYYTQTHVAFGVRYDLSPMPSSFELTPDQIVMDYGKAIQVDVLQNDNDIPATATAELSGFVAYNSNIDTSIIQNSAGDKTFATSNGTYSIVDGKVQFQPKQFLSEIDEVFCSVHITDGEDSYYLYEKLEVIPATTVYYETDFAEDVFTLTNGTTNIWDDDGVPTMDVQDDGTIGVNQTYGYDSTYADDNEYSNGSSLKVEGEQNEDHVVTTTASFDFTGTGFDLISRTGDVQGLIQVKIYSAGNAETPVKTVQVLNKSESNLELYQIPVVSVNDLSYGTYHVTIEVYQAVTYTGILEPLSRGGEFCFDAVKVYNPINVSGTSLYGDAAVAQAAYVADGEANADITEIRQMIIDKKTFDDGSGAIGENAVVFVDRTADGVEVANYETIGPNNEVYLSDGQGIAFQLSSTEIPASIDIGAKSADGKSVYMSANLISTDNEELSASIYQEIESCTAQNYDLMAAADVTISDILSGGSAYVVIFNTGEGILSITDIKVAYGESAGITSFSVTPDVVNAAAKALGAGMVGEEANYDIQSASFDAASCKLGKNATMTVITTDAVETLKVTDYKGKDVSADITSSSENGQTTWKVSLKMTLMGNRTYTVTGYGADGTAGASADAEIKVTLR